jgi:hypothetical protein
VLVVLVVWMVMVVLQLRQAGGEQEPKPNLLFPHPELALTTATITHGYDVSGVD